jgi:hypothetical protein
MGGLGNQLFQIFTVMAYALRNGLEFTFQNCDELPVGPGRPTSWHTLLSELTPFLLPKTIFKGFETVKEKGFRYDPLPDPTARELVFYGYFQSARYFQQEFKTIQEILDIPAKINTMRTRFPDTVRQACMHFRITGYRELPGCHPVAPYEYYKWAVSQVEESEILYFNQPEDKGEVTEIISQLNREFPDKKFVSADQELQDWEQLLLMSCCQSHIIANSSFSWWGAMLGNSSNVYYPCNWFGPDLGHSIKDLVLPNWHGYAP